MIDLEGSIYNWIASQRKEQKIPENNQGKDKILKAIVNQMEMPGREKYDTINVNLFENGVYNVAFSGGLQDRSRFDGAFVDVGMDVVQELGKYTSKIHVEYGKKGNEFFITIKLKKGSR